MISIKSYCRKTAGDLSWPEMNLATWRWVVAIFRLRVSSLPVTRCLRVFRMSFFQKGRLSFLSHWLISNGKVAKWTWPWVTDIKIPGYTFYTSSYGYQSLEVSKWSAIRCSHDEHSTFSEVRSLDVTWWPDLEGPGCEIFTTGAEKMYKQVCQKRRRAAPPFLRYLQKNLNGA